MATPHEYYLSVIGKRFDEDRAYGVQCVDGFHHFCRTVLGYNIEGPLCSPTGYAHSIWDNFEKLGFDKYFDKVPSNQMVDGDWAVWEYGSKPCPYSHIAMFRKDNGNGTGIFLGQNQGSTRAYTQINISYSGVRGGLRPKIYHQSKPAQTGKNYINLPPAYPDGTPIDSWKVYPIDKAPIKKNAISSLNPSKFGGLSYYIHEYRDDGTTAVIEGATMGLIKIYIKDTPATVTIDSYKYNLVN